MIIHTFFLNLDFLVTFLPLFCNVHAKGPKYYSSSPFLSSFYPLTYETYTYIHMNTCIHIYAHSLYYSGQGYQINMPF